MIYSLLTFFENLNIHVYRYRYFLTENKRALVKFLYAVNWDDETEVAEVPSLLALWSKKAPIDVADALKLLSR